MAGPKRARPFIAWLLIVLHFLMGIGGIVSGGMLVVAPDGKYLGWTESLLQGSPFTNYLIPGLILVILIGFFPIFVGWGILTLPSWRWPDAINPTKRFHWSWSASWAAGVIMLVWILVELFMVGYLGFLQPMVIVWGMVEIVLTVMPAMRRYCFRAV